MVFASSGVGREARERWAPIQSLKLPLKPSANYLPKSNVHPNIRFNCINPGATRTAMRAKAYPDEDPKTLPTPDAIMPAYLYLMGDDSLHMNGQSIDAQD